MQVYNWYGIGSGGVYFVGCTDLCREPTFCIDDERMQIRIDGILFAIV